MRQELSPPCSLAALTREGKKAEMIHKKISQAQSGRQRGCRCVGGENTLLQRQLIPAPTQTAAMMVLTSDIIDIVRGPRTRGVEPYTLNSLCKWLGSWIQRCPLSFWELAWAFCTRTMTVWRKSHWWDKKEQNTYEEWLWSLSELTSSDPWDTPVLTVLRKAAESQAWRCKL